MARTFRYSLDRRIINRVIMWLLRSGFTPGNYYLLSVAGRRTGNIHTVPVVLVREGNKQWLVAPYGEVDWVKNARASKVVRLSRGRQNVDYAIRQLPPESSASILKKYLVENPITRPYFNAREDASLAEFVEEAKDKYVFELIKTSTGEADV